MESFILFSKLLDYAALLSGTVYTLLLRLKNKFFMPFLLASAEIKTVQTEVCSLLLWAI